MLKRLSCIFSVDESMLVCAESVLRSIGFDFCCDENGTLLSFAVVGLFMARERVSSFIN